MNEVDSDLAPLVVGGGTTRVELPATILVRSGRPDVEIRIDDCAAVAGATLELADAAGEPLSFTERGACRLRAMVPATPAGGTVDIRVVVTVPDGVTASEEIELVTFQDVCASGGSSEIVSFGS